MIFQMLWKKLNCKKHHRKQIKNKINIVFFLSFALPVLPPDALASHPGNFEKK